MRIKERQQRGWSVVDITWSPWYFSLFFSLSLSHIFIIHYYFYLWIVFIHIILWADFWVCLFDSFDFGFWFPTGRVESSRLFGLSFVLSRLWLAPKPTSLFASVYRKKSPIFKTEIKRNQTQPKSCGQNEKRNFISFIIVVVFPFLVFLIERARANCIKEWNPATLDWALFDGIVIVSIRWLCRLEKLFFSLKRREKEVKIGGVYKVRAIKVKVRHPLKKTKSSTLFFPCWNLGNFCRFIGNIE